MRELEGAGQLNFFKWLPNLSNLVFYNFNCAKCDSMAIKWLFFRKITKIAKRPEASLPDIHGLRLLVFPHQTPVCDAIQLWHLMYYGVFSAPPRGILFEQKFNFGNSSSPFSKILIARLAIVLFQRQYYKICPHPHYILLYSVGYTKGFWVLVCRRAL